MEIDISKDRSSIGDSKSDSKSEYSSNREFFNKELGI